LVFIDPATPDADAILQTLLAQTSDDLVLTIIKYDYGDSGLDTITDTLSKHTNVDAIHIVSDC